MGRQFRRVRRAFFRSYFGLDKPATKWTYAYCTLVWVCIGTVLLFIKFSNPKNAETTAWLTRHLLSAGHDDKVPDIFYEPDCSITNNTGLNLTKGPGLTWETCDIEQNFGYIGAWLFCYIICSIILFIAMAIICDDFFVPSLEAISEKLHLSEDVAGATFMAAGSSAPELFSSIVGVAFQSDVGVGTIAGSAVFNMLVIISLSGAFSKTVFTLDWRPILRDSTFYVFSCCIFIWSVSDTLFQVWEPIVMLVFYAMYIVVMVFNRRLMDSLKRLEKWCVCCKAGKAVHPDGDVEKEIQNSGDQKTHSLESIRSGSIPNVHAIGHRRSSLLQTISANGHGKHSDSLHPVTNGTSHKPALDSGFQSPLTEEEKPNEDTSKGSSLSTKEATKPDESTPRSSNGQKNEENKKIVEEDEDDEEDPHIDCCCACCPPIRGAPPTLNLEEGSKCKNYSLYILKWLIFAPAFPFIILFSYTVPPCNKPHNKKWFMVSFITSVIWIAALSFAMVTTVQRIGCMIGVDTFVMSLVILAAGTSIPDLLSSIIVAREGYGDMAVSNAIGSNVFDILIGMGFPFLIRIIITVGEPFDVFNQTERSSYCQHLMHMIPHLKFGIILLGVLGICVLFLIISKFTLNRVICILFFILYICFLVYAFLQEFLCSKTGLYNC